MDKVKVERNPIIGTQFYRLVCNTKTLGIYSEKKRKSDSDICKQQSILKKQHIKECEKCRSNIYDGYDPNLDIFEIGRPIIFKNDMERLKHKKELKKEFIDNLTN